MICVPAVPRARAHERVTAGVPCASRRLHDLTVIWHRSLRAGVDVGTFVTRSAMKMAGTDPLRGPPAVVSL